MPFKKRKGAQVKVKKGRPRGKEPEQAPQKIKVKGGLHCPEAMGVYHKAETAHASSGQEERSTPVYSHERGHLHLYKTGKRWRIGVEIGIEPGVMACTDTAWWPTDINSAISHAYWQSWDNKSKAWREEVKPSSSGGRISAIVIKAAKIDMFAHLNLDQPAEPTSGPVAGGPMAAFMASNNPAPAPAPAPHRPRPDDGMDDQMRRAMEQSRRHLDTNDKDLERALSMSASSGMDDELQKVLAMSANQSGGIDDELKKAMEASMGSGMNADPEQALLEQALLASRQAEDPPKRKEVDAAVLEDISDDLAAKIQKMLKRQETDVEGAFTKFDTNHDGKLGEQELLRAAEMLRMHLTADETSGLMKMLDRDGDGRISSFEFMRFVQDKTGGEFTKSKSKSKSKPELQRVGSCWAEGMTEQDDDVISVQKVVKVKKKLRKKFEKNPDIFDEFDRDGDGKVSTKEFVKTIRKIYDKSKLSSDEAYALANMIDIDGNGRLSLDEFTKFVGATPKRKKSKEPVEINNLFATKIRSVLRQQDQDLERLFEKFDLDDSGSISEKEFVSAIERCQLGLTEEEALGLMLKFDTDDDGRVSYLEFIGWIEDKQNKSNERGEKPGGKSGTHLNATCERCEAKYFSATGKSKMCIDCRKETHDMKKKKKMDEGRRNCEKCGREYISMSGKTTRCMVCRGKDDVEEGKGQDEGKAAGGKAEGGETETPKESGPEAKAENWKAYWSEKKQSTYYANVVTKKTVWVRPACMPPEEKEQPSPENDPDNWVEHWSEAKQQYYYANSVTKQSVWVRPACMPEKQPEQLKPEDDPNNWSEHFSEAKQKHYYSNNVTKQSVWVRPACMPEKQPEGDATESEYGSGTDSEYADSEYDPEDDPGNWNEYWSEKQHRPYYVNEVTKKTQWDLPPHWEEDEEDQQPEASEGPVVVAVHDAPWAVMHSI